MSTSLSFSSDRISSQSPTLYSPKDKEYICNKKLYANKAYEFFTNTYKNVEILDTAFWVVEKDTPSGILYTKYTQGFGKLLINKSGLVIIPLTLHNEIKNSTHQTLLIYKNNTLYFYDPDGELSHVYSHKVDKLHYIVKDTLKDYDIKYEILEPYDFPLQQLQEMEGVKVKGIEGFCVPWSLFFIYVLIRNPNIKVPTALEKIERKLTTKAGKKEVRNYYTTFIVKFTNYLYKKIQ